MIQGVSIGLEDGGRPGELFLEKIGWGDGDQGGRLWLVAATPEVVVVDSIESVNLAFIVTPCPVCRQFGSQF